MLRKKSSWSWTLALVLINVVFFMIVMLASIFISPAQFEILMGYIALTPSQALSQPWTIITSMFMHAPGFTHIFVNMMSLVFIGAFLEKIVGKKRFIFIYMLAGILGSAFYILSFYFLGMPDIPAVGASGAIFGIGGMLAVLTPKMPVYVLFIPIAMPLWLGITLSLVVMWLLSVAVGLPIGNFAHLGGLVAGLLYALILRMKHPAKARMISRYFSK